MNKYDFHKLFDPMTFQDFSRDMIQIRDNIFLNPLRKEKIKALMADIMTIVILLFYRLNDMIEVFQH